MNYREKGLPELLAPAGSIDHLKAAVLAGADAVYFGGSRFGARAYARNFSGEDVLDALDYLHFHDRRGYLTVNTLIKEKELQTDLYAYLLPFYEAGLDGVIVQDPGAASFIRDHFPGMEIHGSTQMFITGIPGALAAGKLGMNRVVPARELSGEELIAIKEATGLELEVFIHGALCYSYSGQCLLSSCYGGRSGNRGRCAQPCRLPYRAFDADGESVHKTEMHLLSPRDLCSLHLLPSMIRAGVDSLKIEGRMKNIDYVAGVTSIYRHYLDLYASGSPYRIEEKDLEELEELYVRTAFTDGYWSRHNGREMMSVDRPRHLGRKMGKILSIRKNRVLISLTGRVQPKDLLVIPGPGEEELVLTVPKETDLVRAGKKGRWEISLNVPKTPWLTPGKTVYRRHSEALENKIRKNILDTEIKYPVSGSLEFKKDRPLLLRLFSRGIKVVLPGPMPQTAENRPLTGEDVLRQMRKTGEVPFELKEFALDLDNGLFLPASHLKELRQEAYQRLEDDYIHRFYRKVPDRPDSDVLYGEAFSGTASVSQKVREKDIPAYAVVYDREIMDLCLDSPLIRGIVLPMDFYSRDDLISLKEKIHSEGKEACLSLPRVFRMTTKESMEEYFGQTVKKEAWEGIYIHNLNECGILPQTWSEIPRICSASMYAWNSRTIREIPSLDNGCRSFYEMPVELSREEWIEVMKHSVDEEGELMVYGRFPAMLSAQCIKNTLGRCNGRPEICTLKSGTGKKLPVSCHCHPDWIDPASKDGRAGKSCYSMIWTDRPRDLIGQDMGDLVSFTGRFRFDLFSCRPEEVRNLFDRFRDWKDDSWKQMKEASADTGNWKKTIE